jgi:hypothetical protein
VRQALESPLPPERKLPEGRPAPKLGPYRALIDSWLGADREAPRKQRHTARRVWERLRDEHGVEVSERGGLSLRTIVSVSRTRETTPRISGRSKRSYGHCSAALRSRKRNPLTSTPPACGRLSRRPRLRVSHKTRPVMCRGDGASTGTPAAPALDAWLLRKAERRCRVRRGSSVAARPAGRRSRG